MTRSVAARSRGQGGTGGWVMVRVLGTRPLFYFDFPEELGKGSPEAVMGWKEELVQKGVAVRGQAASTPQGRLWRSRLHIQ